MSWHCLGTLEITCYCPHQAKWQPCFPAGLIRPSNTGLTMSVRYNEIYKYRSQKRFSAEQPSNIGNQSQLMVYWSISSVLSEQLFWLFCSSRIFLRNVRNHLKMLMFFFFLTLDALFAFTQVFVTLHMCLCFHITCFPRYDNGTLVRVPLSTADLVSEV